MGDVRGIESFEGTVRNLSTRRFRAGHDEQMYVEFDLAKADGTTEHMALGLNQWNMRLAATFIALMNGADLTKSVSVVVGPRWSELRHATRSNFLAAQVRCTVHQDGVAVTPAFADGKGECPAPITVSTSADEFVVENTPVFREVGALLAEIRAKGAAARAIDAASSASRERPSC